MIRRAGFLLKERKKLVSNFLKFPFSFIRFPPGRGDLNGEVGWREEGEYHGGYVVAAVEHALAEKSNGVGVGWRTPGVFGEGHKVSLVDDVEN